MLKFAQKEMKRILFYNWAEFVAIPDPFGHMAPCVLTFQIFVVSGAATPLLII